MDQPALPDGPIDVLVAGGGNAGMSAAINAASAGLKVVVCEVAPRHMRAGNTRHTRNLRIMHEAPKGVLVGTYLEEEYFDDLMRVTGGETDRALARFTIQRSGAAMDWLMEMGVLFQPALSGTLSLAHTNAFFLGGGKALANALYRKADELGVIVVYEAAVTGVDVVERRFRSATVSIGNETRKIEAKAFIAAAGGFEANIPWLKEYWGEAAENFRIRGTPYNKGQVLRALLDAGVQPVGDPKQCHAVAIDGRAPQFDGGIATRLDSVPFGIVVNREGKRFHDEGEDFWPKRYAIWGRLVAEQAGQVAYSIVDAKAAEDFMPSMFEPVTAGSIGELAEKLGLDPGSLGDTVDAYNAAVQPGSFDHTVLDDCKTLGLYPPKSHWARTIDKPPFAAFALSPGITFTYLGVKVDDSARVLLSAGGLPSPNIFAAGEIMAGNVLGQGYLAGIGMTIGSVFGQLAGREAARYVTG
ncbi:MAG TPA: FAD-dependent tricarballylate dehydrogenase TcuA [Alphaproteobacteria bacterium]|nr:FAD-dependent tricarballylate dehydrogenase TcuA [Alphaproteobacteria bacterium]